MLAPATNTWPRRGPTSPASTVGQEAAGLRTLRGSSSLIPSHVRFGGWEGFGIAARVAVAFYGRPGLDADQESQRRHHQPGVAGQQKLTAGLPRLALGVVNATVQFYQRLVDLSQCPIDAGNSRQCQDVDGKAATPALMDPGREPSAHAWPFRSGSDVVVHGKAPNVQLPVTGDSSLPRPWRPCKDEFRPLHLHHIRCGGALELVSLRAVRPAPPAGQCAAALPIGFGGFRT